VRASSLPSAQTLVIADRPIDRARVFSDVPAGNLFWYENSIGLIEIAANQANASGMLGVSVGTQVLVAG
jgi:S-adenosylmethionine hydrolase